MSDEPVKSVPTQEQFEAWVDRHKDHIVRQREENLQQRVTVALKNDKCPQCGAGLHPEVISVIKDWLPPVYNAAASTVVYNDCVCCVRCVEAMKDAVNAKRASLGLPVFVAWR